MSGRACGSSSNAKQRAVRVESGDTINHHSASRVPAGKNPSSRSLQGQRDRRMRRASASRCVALGHTWHARQQRDPVEQRRRSATGSARPRSSRADAGIDPCGSGIARRARRACAARGRLRRSPRAAAADPEAKASKSVEHSLPRGVGNRLAGLVGDREEIRQSAHRCPAPMLAKYLARPSRSRCAGKAVHQLLPARRIAAGRSPARRAARGRCRDTRS